MNKKNLESLEEGFIIVGFLFFSGSLGKLDLFPSSFMSLIRYTLPLGSLFLMAHRFKSIFYKFKRNPFLIITVSLALLSFLWSDISDISLQLIQSQLFPMTAFGLYLGVSFRIERLIEKLGKAVIVGLLLSWMAVMVMPEIGIDHEKFAGAWKGLYGHKNETSTYMILTALTLLVHSFRKSSRKLLGIHTHKWFKYLGFFALIFAFLTNSGTGLVLSAVIYFTLFLYYRFRWKGKLTILFLDLATLLFGLTAIIVIGNWGTILTGAGKDPTISGRTTFWSIAIQAIWQDSPLLGFGRSGFWSPIYPYREQIATAFGASRWSEGYVPPHAHNGFIELSLDLGIIGLSFFILSLLVAWIRSLKQAYKTHEMKDLYPLGFMILFTVNNLTESYTTYLTHMLWPIYIAISLNVGTWDLKKLKSG